MEPAAAEQTTAIADADAAAALLAWLVRDAHPIAVCPEELLLALLLDILLYPLVPLDGLHLTHLVVLADWHVNLFVSSVGAESVELLSLRVHDMLAT